MSLGKNLIRHELHLLKVIFSRYLQEMCLKEMRERQTILVSGTDICVFM